ncbi:hypothetical protein ACUM5Y_10705 [Marinomonas dokdonensis]|uniref:hypothetical protein n=1 Tax=Marinomonas dokdonensis TaxID=328224 RepID=UPI0040556CD6
MSYESNYLCDGVYGGPFKDEIEGDEFSAKILNKEDFNNIFYRISLNDDLSYSPLELLDSIFKKILTPEVIRLTLVRYCRSESISTSYSRVFGGGYNISDVVSSNLNGFCIFDSVISIKELSDFFEMLGCEKDLTPYEKVGEVQRKIHHEYDVRNGRDSYLKMDKEVMRKTLSIIRLHFLKCEVERIDLKSFIMLLDRNLKKSKEVRNIVPGYVEKSNSVYVESWGARYQHTLYFYLPENYRKFINKLIRLSKTKDKNDIYIELNLPISDFIL